VSGSRSPIGLSVAGSAVAVHRGGGRLWNATDAGRGGGMAPALPPTLGRDREQTEVGPVRDPRDEVVEDRRPWGRFRRYAYNETCTVKIIEVEAGERLSLQLHRNRDEMWVVLDDGLEVELDGETTRATSGQEFLVRRGTTHRVAGGEKGGRFLEIAFGEFDEDDIERLDDDYGRT
jgi:mannose-6-phosphate isomerase